MPPSLFRYSTFTPCLRLYEDEDEEDESMMSYEKFVLFLWGFTLVIIHNAYIAMALILEGVLERNGWGKHDLCLNWTGKATPMFAAFVGLFSVIFKFRYALNHVAVGFGLLGLAFPPSMYYVLWSTFYLSEGETENYNWNYTLSDEEAHDIIWYIGAVPKVYYMFARIILTIVQINVFTLAGTLRGPYDSFGELLIGMRLSGVVQAFINKFKDYATNLYVQENEGLALTNEQLGRVDHQCFMLIMIITSISFVVACEMTHRMLQDIKLRSLFIRSGLRIHKTNFGDGELSEGLLFLIEHGWEVANVAVGLFGVLLIFPAFVPKSLNMSVDEEGRVISLFNWVDLFMMILNYIPFLRRLEKKLTVKQSFIVLVSLYGLVVAYIGALILNHYLSGGTGAVLTLEHNYMHIVYILVALCLPNWFRTVTYGIISDKLHSKEEGTQVGNIMVLGVNLGLFGSTLSAFYFDNHRI